MKKRGFFLFKWEDIFKHWDVADKRSEFTDQKFSVKDVAAMIIAALSIVMPWVLAIIGSLALVLFLIYKFYLRQ